MSVNYIYLIAAIFLEVTGTMLLPVSANFTRLWPTLRWRYVIWQRSAY